MTLRQQGQSAGAGTIAARPGVPLMPRVAAHSAA
jgi:hypothetical protein